MFRTLDHYLTTDTRRYADGRYKYAIEAADVIVPDGKGGYTLQKTPGDGETYYDPDEAIERARDLAREYAQANGLVYRATENGGLAIRYTGNARMVDDIDEAWEWFAYSVEIDPDSSDYDDGGFVELD